MTEISPELVYPTACLRWNGKLWVPHYQHIVTYVSPGNVMLQRFELIDWGATWVTEMLWKRPT